MDDCKQFKYKNTLMEIKLKVKCPILPNYLIIVGTEKETTIPIESLTIQQVDEYLEMYKENFLNHWRVKQKTH